MVIESLNRRPGLEDMQAPGDALVGSSYWASPHSLRFAASFK